MAKLIFSILFSTLVFFTAHAQFISTVSYPDTTKALIEDPADPRVKFSNTITAEDIKKHLSILASDEYEGRETGEDGNNKAAVYIADQFKNIGFKPTGLENSYYQPVIFTSTGWNDTEIYVNEERYKHLWDYLAYPTSFSNMPQLTADEVLWMGYGIDDPKYSDYKNKNVTGKVLMVYLGEPMNADSISYITGNKNISDWSTNVGKKIEVAKSKGAKMVFLVSNDLKGFLMENRKYLLGPGLQLGDLREEAKNSLSHAYISTKLAEAIIGSKTKKLTKARQKIAKKGKSKPVKLPTKMRASFDNYFETLEGQNVIGFLEGTDKKEEVVVVSAHYDHLGKRGEDIFNGADDNGSGTSTVLDIAEAFMQAKAEGNGPRRSILFILVTGEEKGLLGSQYYAENPTVPLKNIIANVNVDMVGRIDDRHDHDNYIYVIGSDRLSTTLHEINEKANQDFTQMELDYTYNSEDDPNRYYYRSDHYNFAVKGIPAIFFFSGVHVDYHRPSDTVEKILFDKAAKTGKLIFQTIWELANREERIKVDVAH